LLKKIPKQLAVEAFFTQEMLLTYPWIQP